MRYIMLLRNLERSETLLQLAINNLPHDKDLRYHRGLKLRWAPRSP